jgi:hypothetical protein
MPSGELVAMSADAGFVMTARGDRCNFNVTKLKTMNSPPMATIVFDEGPASCLAINNAGLSQAVMLPEGI